MLKKILLFCLVSTTSVSSLKPISTVAAFEYVKSDAFLNSYSRLFMELGLMLCGSYFFIKGHEHIKSENEVEAIAQVFSEALGKTYPTKPLHKKLMNKNSLNFVLGGLLILAALVPGGLKMCKDSKLCKDPSEKVPLPFIWIVLIGVAAEIGCAHFL